MTAISVALRRALHLVSLACLPAGGVTTIYYLKSSRWTFKNESLDPLIIGRDSPYLGVYSVFH
ncbi:MAG: hypothetical protein ACE5KV_04655, partial [Thermoplasmata archaeon]